MNTLPYQLFYVFRISALVITSYFLSTANVLASNMSSPTRGIPSSLLSGNITYVTANVSGFTTNSSDFTTHSTDFTTVISTTLSDIMPPLPVNISGWPPATQGPPQAPTGTAAPPTPVCEINGHTYQISETFTPDPCTFCTCSLVVVGDLPRGHVTCELADCLYHIQAAPCVDLTVPEGQCCPMCPNGPTCHAPDGSVLGHGQVYRPEEGGECWCLGPSFGGDAPCTTPTTTRAPPTTTHNTPTTTQTTPTTTKAPPTTTHNTPTTTQTTPTTTEAPPKTAQSTPSTTMSNTIDAPSNTTEARFTAVDDLTTETTSVSSIQSTTKSPVGVGLSATTASSLTTTKSSTSNPMPTAAAPSPSPSTSSPSSTTTTTTSTAQPSTSGSTTASSTTSTPPRTTRRLNPVDIIG